MKKLLLSLAAIAAFSVASAEEITLDFTKNAYGQTVAGSSNDKYNMPDGTSFSDGVITITANTLTGNGARFWATDAGAQTFRCNKNSGITVSVEGGNITKIVFTGSNCNNYTVDGTKLSNNTWEGSSASVAFVNSGTSTIQMKTMTVTYGGGVADTRKDAGLAFPEEKYTISMGDEFTAPALTKATTAAVTYASDKETVATVDATTGAVTVVGVGTARITASAEANDEFKAGSASYLLTVKKAAPEGSVYYNELGSDFTFENPEGAEVWKHDTSYGLKASAFINKKAVAAEAFAISPVIDLTNVVDPVLNFESALNQFKINNEMIPVDQFADYCFIMAREEGATSWQSVAEATAPESFSWNFFSNEPVKLDAFQGKKMQIAFLYVSTDECAGTWEVKNIAVTGGTNAIEAVEAADADAPVEYFNLQGVRVANPEGGIFIRRQGSNVSKVIVK